MTLTPQEQFKNFLENSHEVLILISENPSCDAVGSAWGLYFFLEKRGLNPTIAFGNHLSQKFEFLPKPQRLMDEISGARDFVLSFNTSRNKISSIREERLEDTLNIYLTPERGTINPRDFSFILAKFKYELIVVIDSPDLEKLGDIYLKNTDLFFEVPVVNIDYRSDNDNFGQTNLIDVTACSCSEIIKESMEKIDAEAIDKNIATCLLTGIIGATDSFQKKNTKPRSLLAAADLMDKGADQQEIVRWLYKTQPLHILKLLGRVMAKLMWDEETKTAWAHLNIEDFVHSRASQSDIPVILEKLQENYSEGKTFMIIFNDTPNTSLAIIHSSNNSEILKIKSALNGELKRDILEVKFQSDNLTEISQAIIDRLKTLN